MRRLQLLLELTQLPGDSNEQNDSSTNIPSTSYLSLFEPLAQRASELQPLQSNPSIPLSKLQAESVTGTHLYAYLEEAAMPDYVAKPRDDVADNVRQLTEVRD